MMKSTGFHAICLPQSDWSRVSLARHSIICRCQNRHDVEIQFWSSDSRFEFQTVLQVSFSFHPMVSGCHCWGGTFGSQTRSFAVLLQYQGFFLSLDPSFVDDGHVVLPLWRQARCPGSTTNTGNKPLVRHLVLRRGVERLAPPGAP